MNTSQLSEGLALNYKTVQHYLEILEENTIVTLLDDNYDQLYFLSDRLEQNLDILEEANLKNMIGYHRLLGKTALITGIAALLGLLSSVILLNTHRGAGGPIPEFIQLVIRIELFITTFNLVLLLGLSWAYLSLYRELPNKYSMSLVILSLVLLLYALTSNPFIRFLFGFPPGGELGPFSFIPDLFVSLAIIVLFYQSQT